MVAYHVIFHIGIFELCGNDLQHLHHPFAMIRCVRVPLSGHLFETTILGCGDDSDNFEGLALTEGARHDSYEANASELIA